MFEAVNERPSQEAPGSVPASVVPSRKTPVIRLPSNKPIRRPNPINCPPDKSGTKAKEAVSPRSHEATTTCQIPAKKQEKETPEESVGPSTDTMNTEHPADVPGTTDKPKRSRITEVGGWVIWTAIQLFLLLTNPVFGQSL